jgi:tRNA (guanine37-N1)-methyltransferase
MKSLCIKVKREDGEKTRRKLIELGAINADLKIRSENGFLLIPVTREIDGFAIETADFEVLEKDKSIIELLGFSPAYEQIGDTALIDRSESDPQLIAEALLRQNKIKTVLQSETSVSGEYRTRDVTIIAGEPKTETVYKENGCRYKLDIAKVYFTPRLSTERMRIAEQVKDCDFVVDMFAGVGPFSILIAKINPNARVVAIDKNPVAIRYFKENVILNKVKNVEIREGDAREEVKGLCFADHVIMNLPHSNLEFLDAAFSIVKNGGLIHFYAITQEDDLFDGMIEKIKESAKRNDFSIHPINKRVVRPYAPYQYNICIDFRVTSAEHF